MDEKTLAALKGSIYKWEGIVHQGGIDIGAENCPLCVLYNNLIDLCKGCPVREKVRASHCDRTPYQEWFEYQCLNERSAIDEDLDDFKVFDKKSKEIAQAELDFLKSLLPEGDD